MKNLKEKLFFLSFIMFSTLLTAQGLKIKGKVLDATDQMPLIGASITVQGTTKGAATDFDGGYVLTAEPGDVLVFSYLGYEDLKITVGESSVVNANLKVKADALTEVVVIAYGKSTKKELTGSVTSIKAETFKDRPIVTIEDALQGNASGLQLQSSGGQPGASANINIRGVTSLSGSTQPLVVIDGFPIDEVQTSGGLGMDQFSNQISPFAFVNPNDIESIEILKDASATALYGIRGANGVILITTKKGKVGKTKVSYNTYLGIRDMKKRIGTMNFNQYVDFRQSSIEAGYNEPQGLFADGATGEPYAFQDNLPSKDWQDEIYRTGIVQSHSLSVQGGAENTRFLLSGSYLQDQSIIIQTAFKKYDIRLNVDQTINDRLKFGVTLSNNYIYNDGVPTDGREGDAVGTVMSALIARPYVIQDPDAQAYFLRAGSNPDVISAFSNLGADGSPTNLARQTQLDKALNRFMFSGWSEWAVNKKKDLKLKLFAGGDMFNGKDLQFSPSTTPNGFNARGIANVTNFLNRSFITENTLSYKINLGNNHNLDALLGGSIQESRFEWVGTTSSNFDNESLGTFGIGNATQFRNSSMVSLVKRIGLLARLNYSYKSIWLLTLNARHDGTSRFANDKWATFPSAALGYNLAEEKFIKDNMGRTLNLLKLRASIGQIGNSNVPTSGSYAQTNIANYNLNGQEVSGIVPGNLANPDLTWEITQQTNGGIDLNMFNNKISITADYYIKKTKDLLLQAPVPPIYGFGTAYKNVGEVENSGFEFSLSTINVKTDNFEWNSSFNITTNKSRINKLGQDGQPIYLNINFDTQVADEVILQEGGQIGDLYGYVQDGVYTPDDEVSPGVFTPSADFTRYGEIKYKDLNGDGKITADDRTVIGNTLPEYFGSLTNNFIYKNLELNVILQYSVGNDVFNATRTRTEVFTSSTENQSTRFLNRWTPNNPTSTQYASMGSIRSADTWVEDASFLRIRNVRLGYNLPSSLFQKLKITNIKMYVSADNIAVFTKYTGYDPEISSNIGDAQYSRVLSSGFDYGAFPRARTFTFGLNVDF